MSVEVKILKLGAYRTNCYVVSNDLGETFVVDPGAEPGKILDALNGINDLKLRFILLTHAHFDHVGALGELHKAFPGTPIYLHENDFSFFRELPEQGIFVGEIVHQVQAELEAISGGIYIPFGGDNIKVIHTPGHSAGSVCYLLTQNTKNKIQNTLFSGDTLFYHTIGRTDLPYSDERAMRTSLDSLRLLGVDTRVLPGHGRETTIEEELANNSYFL